ARVRGGKRAAAAAGRPRRAPRLPDGRTTAEAGYPGASYVFWSGLFVPAKTPKEIVARLHDESAKALALPEIQAKLTKLGVDPLTLTSEGFQDFFANDVAETVKLAKEAGITPTD